MVKLFDLIKYGITKLYNSNTPQLDAEVILSNILKKDRIYLYLNREETVDESVEERFKKDIERRAKGEPVAYIIGEKEFMGLNFKVKPGVLIPRGDTEILIEEVLKKAKEQRNDNPIIVDIGCGSGAISIALAKNIEKAVLYSVDIMDIPLEVTRENACLNNVQDRINIVKSDLLSGLDLNLMGKIDIIVSNPPYIEEAEIGQLMPDVKNYEPISALSGGEDGLDFYRSITQESKKYLKPQGLLAYEIGYNQGKEVMEILKQNGFCDIEVVKDLAGLDRVVLGKLRIKN